MKKLLWFLVILVSFIEIVYADEFPLIKDREVARVEINDELWFTPDRVLYEFGENYLVYDFFHTNYITIGERPNWRGDFLKKYTFYDKNWKEILEHSNSNFFEGDGNYFIVNNKIYNFFYDYVLNMTVYDEDFQFKTYTLDFWDDVVPYDFGIVDVIADESNIYILLKDIDLYKEIRLYDDNSKYEIFDLDLIEVKERFPEYYYRYKKMSESYFIVGNNIYAFYNDDEMKMTIYKENSNLEIYNLDFWDDVVPYDFGIVDVIADESNIYILLKDADIFKEVRLYDGNSKYEIFDLDLLEVEERFPKYYNEGNQRATEEVYYDCVGNDAVISGDILVYIENGNEKFRIKNEKYKKYGQARKYNNLIISIAYKGDSFKSDILFYDLNGNLIGTFEHNAYDIDLLFKNNQLVVATLYVDGICDIFTEGYYSYNHNCSSVLMNEIYDLKPEFLGMALGTSIEEKPDIVTNPDTLGMINRIIMLCFITSIVITICVLVKKKFKII